MDQERWFDYDVDVGDALFKLFFHHKTTIMLLSQFFKVMIIDCKSSLEKNKVVDGGNSTI